MSIEQIFTDFTRLRVLVIGDVMIDSYIWGSVERISPEAPVPVIHVRKRDLRLGGAANVALNVQALGARPVLVALRGADDAGQRLEELMKTQQLPVDGLVPSASRPTTVKTRVIAQQQHVVRVDDESDALPTEEEENRLLEAVERLLPDADIVIFEDYDKGTLSARVIAETLRLAREQKKTYCGRP